MSDESVQEIPEDGDDAVLLAVEGDPDRDAAPDEAAFADEVEVEDEETPDAA
jgi:hypothetical protein